MHETVAKYGDKRSTDSRQSKYSGDAGPRLPLIIAALISGTISLILLMTNPVLFGLVGSVAICGALAITLRSSKKVGQLMNTDIFTKGHKERADAGKSNKPNKADSNSIHHSPSVPSITPEEEKILAEEWESGLKRKIYKHRFALKQERAKSVIADAYGNEDMSKWHNLVLLAYGMNPSQIRNLFSPYSVGSGIGYFWRNVLLDDPDSDEAIARFIKGWNAFRKTTFTDPCEFYVWAGYIQALVDNEIFTLSANQSRAIADSDISQMSGSEYEEYCQEILLTLGWDVEKTPASNDQGVDLIATYGSCRLCIQCKNYAAPVGNKAVQEVVAGKIYYVGSHAAVVAPNGFTRSAQELAKSTGVILLSEEELLSRLLEGDTLLF